MKRLLAIVICWNRPEFLRRTLDSLFRFLDGCPADVVAVDNGSDWPTQEILRSDSRLHAVIRFAVNRGLNGAIEEALDRVLTADHDSVLISDADMEYQVPLSMATDLLETDASVGAVSLQHSPEHAAHGEIEYGGRSWPLKWTERGCALLLRTETLLGVRPLPIDNLKDFDWWVCRDAARSLQKQRRPIAVLPGGARHLGWRKGDSTWQPDEIPEFAEFRG